ncbi:MAG: aldo/keto reductase [Tannerellaceae bacterium]|jgi:predicted aldo/keto reductase-like oxidoreductase|nr:aldo/keto reductase [Tannerellaceae bacterium]
MEKKGVNRRNFLRISATAGAGALLIPGAAASTLNKTETAKKTAFPMRTLGRTGIKLPILSMGVMRADNPNIVRAAYNSGLIHFDTAHGYGRGMNETMLGNFFKDKPRDSFILATKCKPEWPLSDNFEKEYTDMFDLSLQRLQMKQVDWLYVHDLNDPAQVKNERLINVIKKFKADGKTKFLALSMHANNPKVIDAAVEAGVYDIILLSYNFKLNNLKELDPTIERAAKAGIGFVAMKTMTGGREDAEGNKKVNAQACLKWAWQNEHIATIIPGFTNFDELDECLAAVGNTTLSGGEKEYLAALCNEEGLYCQQCGICLDQCPEKLPVPDLMRAYMYAYGYKYAQLSKETLEELNLPENVCTNCDTCKIKCPSGFNVGRKIAAIAPVRNIPTEFLS